MVWSGVQICQTINEMRSVLFRSASNALSASLAVRGSSPLLRIVQRSSIITRAGFSTATAPQPATTTASTSTATTTTTAANTETAPAVKPSAPAVKVGTGKKQKIVVLGCGWGGFSFLSTLDRSKFEVYCVSPRNYFLYASPASAPPHPLLAALLLSSVRAGDLNHFLLMCQTQTQIHPSAGVDDSRYTRIQSNHRTSSYFISFDVLPVVVRIDRHCKTYHQMS